MIGIVFNLVKESGTSGLFLYLLLFISTYCPGLAIYYIQQPIAFNNTPLAKLILIPLVYTLPILFLNLILASIHGAGFIPNPTAPPKEETDRRISFFLSTGSLYTFLNLGFALGLYWFFKNKFTFDRLVLLIIVLEVLTIVSALWARYVPRKQIYLDVASDDSGFYQLNTNMSRIIFDEELMKNVVEAYIQVWFNNVIKQELVKKRIDSGQNSTDFDKCYMFDHVLFSDDGKFKLLNTMYLREGDSYPLENIPVSNPKWADISPNSIIEEINKNIMLFYKTKDKFFRKHNLQLYHDVYTYLAWLSNGYLILWAGNIGWIWYCIIPIMLLAVVIAVNSFKKTIQKAQSIGLSQ